MASTFATTQPVVRDHVIDGRAVRMTIDAEGITFTRKGDRHREKPEVTITWEQVLLMRHDGDDRAYVDTTLGFARE